MISYLEGRVQATFGNVCVLLTPGGVGYSVALPAHTLQALPKQGEQVAFFTHLVVREDNLELFGFSTLDELQTFEKLITITKVGARTAQAILSIFRPDDLRSMVTHDDSSLLIRVPGIGKKTAQRIFLELKDKLGPLNVEEIVGTSFTGDPQVFRNVLDGLAGLGYSEKESIPVVTKILQATPTLSIAEALRAALKALSEGQA
ncbi:MAG: Holliday junction branch migration protein RuvA [Desulfovibrionaceae bacterium]|nr:Holliday junction branch migration protein RuvA [Desulfovibrionaceae bacterium]